MLLISLDLKNLVRDMECRSTLVIVSCCSCEVGGVGTLEAGAGGSLDFTTSLVPALYTPGVSTLTASVVS